MRFNACGAIMGPAKEVLLISLTTKSTKRTKIKARNFVSFVNFVLKSQYVNSMPFGYKLPAFFYLWHMHLVDKDRCKGCGLCVTVCPKNVLEISDEINTKGYFPAYQARPEDCIFCALCCTMCPDVAITISEIEEAAAGKK